MGSDAFGTIRGRGQAQAARISSGRRGVHCHDAPDAILGTGALGINNRGQIVGATILTRTIENGFLLAKGAFTTIRFPGTLSTGVADINNRGQMVGQYGAADGRIHGFLLEDGVFTTIDAPGAINTNASDINERGEIVVFYLEANEGQ